MSTNRSRPRVFKIRGSAQMLAALATAIELALRHGVGKITRDSIIIQAETTNSNANDLRYQIDSVDDAVNTLSGWAEPKRCVDCDEPVALLFDDAYLETPDGHGVICCECYRRSEDGGEET